MILQELQIAVLDVISEIIEEPVVNPEEVRENIKRLFAEAAIGEKETA
jgi:hypothetical protein